MKDKRELKDFLDRKVSEYNQPGFIAMDPVSVPHRFSRKQDIEIAGFFAATFAWGNRATIIRKCVELMKLMDNSPYEFIIHHSEKERRRFEGFCHRTFNATDLLYFISFLQHHYGKHDSLEQAFVPKGLRLSVIRRGEAGIVEAALDYFHSYFFSLEDSPERTRKHVAAPARNSACKRLNMFLRWMVRNDGMGVDFGIWKEIKSAELVCPLDMHVARVARRFGLLNRPTADWKAALRLTAHLRGFDPKDPVKYDFALFALGVMEKF